MICLANLFLALFSFYNLLKLYLFLKVQLYFYPSY